MIDLLKNLNEKQCGAVTAIQGPVLVIAGAGSGKTMVLTHRIAHIIARGIATPDRILAVTFTNKAAGEMKERVHRLLRDSPLSSAALSIGTFHSICLVILRAHAKECGLEDGFVIFDTRDQESLIKEICEKMEINTEKFTPGSFLHTISTLKSRLVAPETFADESTEPFDRMAARVYLAYQDGLREHNAVDFDDMIMMCVQLLQKHDDILAQYQEKFRYILIDEYQDTNYAQYQFVTLLAKKYRNICAVGDLDQAIYGWRQADITNILNFEKEYPDAKVVVLEENYRSTQTILSAANTVISKNKMRKEKNLFTRNDAGEKISVVVTDNERKEAEFVARTIMELGRTRRAESFSDVAVLYRTNAQSRAIEETFLRYRIPYKVIGGLKFYERKEIKDVLAYLRVIANPRDTVSLKRIINLPPRGIGKVSLDRFFARGERTAHIEEFFTLIDALKEERATMPLSKFIKMILKRSGLEEYLAKDKKEGASRIENIHELISAASYHDEEKPEVALTTFLDNAALVARENEEGSGGAVHVLTMHAAKGLEFSSVFIIGMEDNIFPHSRSKQSPAEMEEERRLCYVAITRAKKNLWLSYARARTVYGQTQSNPPSRFLFDIPERLVSFSVYEGGPSVSRDDFESGIIDIEW